PVPPPPPAAPHRSAATKTGRRYSPPPAPVYGLPVAGTSPHWRYKPAHASAPSPESCYSKAALPCRRTERLKHPHLPQAPRQQTSASHSHHHHRTQLFAAPHTPAGTGYN